MAELQSETNNKVVLNDDILLDIASRLDVKPRLLFGMGSHFTQSIPFEAKDYLAAIQTEFPYLRFINTKHRNLSEAELQTLYKSLHEHQRSALAVFYQFHRKEFFEELYNAGCYPEIPFFHSFGIACQPPVNFFMLVAKSPGVILDSIDSEGEDIAPEKLTQERIRKLSAFVPNSDKIDSKRNTEYRDLFAHIVLADIDTIRNRLQTNTIEKGSFNEPVWYSLMQLACRLGRKDVVDIFLSNGLPKCLTERDSSYRGAYECANLFKLALRYGYADIADLVHSKMNEEQRSHALDSWGREEHLGVSYEYLSKWSENPDSFFPNLCRSGNYAGLENGLRMTRQTLSLYEYAHPVHTPANMLTAFLKSFSVDTFTLSLGELGRLTEVIVRIVSKEEAILLAGDISQYVTGDAVSNFGNALTDAFRSSNIVSLAVLSALYPSVKQQKPNLSNSSEKLEPLPWDWFASQNSNKNPQVHNILRNLLCLLVESRIDIHRTSIVRQQEKTTALIELLLKISDDSNSFLDDYWVIAAHLLKHKEFEDASNTRYLATQYPKIEKFCELFLKAWKTQLKTERDAAEFIFKEFKDYSGYGRVIPASVGRFFAGHINTTFGPALAEFLETQANIPLQDRGYAMPFESREDVMIFLNAFKKDLSQKTPNLQGQFAAILRLVVVLFCENSPFTQPEQAIAPEQQESSSSSMSLR